MLKKFFILFAFTAITIVSCKKTEDVTPSSKIVGTWKIESAIYTQNGKQIDYWTLASAFYPCVKDISFAFAKGNAYSTTGATTCKDENGEQLSFLPNAGTYVISADNKLTITATDKTVYSGLLTFTSDTKMKWDVTDGTDTISITLAKK